MKDFPIGATVRIKCVEVTDKENGNCDKCVFNLNGDCYEPGRFECRGHYRPDKTDVYFELCQEEK